MSQDEMITTKEYEELKSQGKKQSIELFLNHILNNPNNEWLIDTTLETIHNETYKLLSEFNIYNDTLMKKLHTYYWVRDIDELYPGRFIRWIVINPVKIKKHIDYIHNQEVSKLIQELLDKKTISKKDLKNKELVDFIKQECCSNDDEHFFLTKGVLVLDIRKDHRIYCRTLYRYNGSYQFFYIHFDEHIIFQKFTQQELFILDLNEISK